MGATAGGRGRTPRRQSGSTPKASVKCRCSTWRPELERRRRWRHVRLALFDEAEVQAELGGLRIRGVDVGLQLGGEVGAARSIAVHQDDAECVEDITVHGFEVGQSFALGAGMHREELDIVPVDIVFEPVANPLAESSPAGGVEVADPRAPAIVVVIGGFRVIDLIGDHRLHLDLQRVGGLDVLDQVVGTVEPVWIDVGEDLPVAGGILGAEGSEGAVRVVQARRLP